MMRIIRIDDFDVAEWRKKYSWTHAIGLIDDGLRKTIRRVRNDVYIKMVPANPLLKLFGLLRFDKNSSELRYNKEICFESEDAKRFYNKYCRDNSETAQINF